MPCSSTVQILNLAKALTVEDLQSYFKQVNGGEVVKIVLCSLPVRCAHIKFSNKFVAARVLEKRHRIRNVPLNILPVEEMESLEIFREVQAAISPNLIGKMLESETSLDAVLRTLEQQIGVLCTHTPDTHECLITGDWNQIQGAYKLITQYLTEDKLSKVEQDGAAASGGHHGDADDHVSFTKQTLEGAKWCTGEGNQKIQRQVSCPVVGTNSSILTEESESETVTDVDGSTLIVKKTLKYNSSFETVSEKDEIDAFQALSLIDYTDPENSKLKRRPSTLAEMFQSHRPKLEDCSISKNHVSVGEPEPQMKNSKKKAVALKREDAGQQYRPVFDLSTDD